MSDIDEKIISIIDKIRPLLLSDGGDIKFIKFENGIVYVKLAGHCVGCPMASITLKENIEVAITNEIPEVVEVRNVD